MKTESNKATSQNQNEQKKNLSGKYLTFFLGNEEYGIAILKVIEIIGVMEITAVPRTPRFIKGVINLRGKVIPIMDLRLKFDMEAKEQTDETVVIVVEAQGIEMGIVVDKVSEVLDISGNQIEDTPSFGVDVDTDYILGIGKINSKVKLLLDIDKIISAKDVIAMNNAATAGENFSFNQITTENK
jgi:purine-binding chemotaxis protein CheW